METQDSEVVLLAAAAGYGKSTLLWEWSLRDPRNFIWLSPEALDTGISLIRGAGERSLVAVIDDAHLGSSDVLADLLPHLVRELPAGSALALASRTNLSLPVGRLRAQRSLVELRTPQLAMTPAEAGALMRRVGVDLDPGTVQVLTQRTEGWPVGLYLAAVWLHDRGGNSADLNDFGGHDHLLAEYFRDEVLAGVPCELAEFMVCSSVLDELSAPLCDAVMRRRGSGPLLAQAARTNLFLRPADGAHEHYRWHELLRESFERELRRAAPDLHAELHARTSVWWSQRGDVDRAIAHAVAAGDAERVADLLWPNVASYAMRGRGAQVQHWLGGLAPHQTARHPKLALSAAHVAMAMGDFGQAHAWRLHAAEAIEQCADVHRDDSVMAAAALVDAMTARADLSGMSEAATRAYDLAPPGSPWRPLACMLKGTALHLAGELKSAQPLLREGSDLGLDGAPSVAALCLAQSAVIALEQGDCESAAERTDRATDLLEAQGLLREPALALVFAAAAAAEARVGRSDQAKGDLGRGIDLLASLGDCAPWYGAETRIMLAHAALSLADIVRARTLLAEASRLARRTPGIVTFSSWFDRAWAYIDTLAEHRLSGPSALTIAELRILRFLPTHRSLREIGDQLGVSANTVKTQAHAVYRKLEAASRSEAVARAREAGLLAA